MSANDRPGIVIYGNCQAQFLHHLVTQVPSLTQRAAFHLVSPLAGPNDPAIELRVDPSSIVLVWEQYDHRSGVAARDDLLRAVSPACRRIRFPAVGFNAFWPFLMKDPRNRSEEAYPWGRFPLGDRVARDVAGLGLSPGDAYACYLERSHAKMPELQRLLAIDRNVLAQRDAACDVTMSDVVFANLRDVHQFWTHGHLAIGVVAVLLERLLDAGSDIVGEIDARVRSELVAAYERSPGQGDVQLPLHPLVIDRLGLRFADADTRYRWYGNTWTFPEFTQRLIAFDRNW